MYKVYKHENSINGKVYIGITSMDVSRRWENGNGYSKQPLFWRAIQKYGWNSFSHEIIYSDLSKEEAEQKEIELISLYSSNNPQYGYNIQNCGSTYGKHSEETRRKMSETHKGKIIPLEQRLKISNTLKGQKLSPKTRKKISEAHKGEKAYWYGKTGPTKGRKASPEELLRMSEAHKGKKLSEETKRKISEALKGENSPWYGRKHTDVSIAKMKESASNKRSVRCVETGIIYKSIKDAGEHTGINYRNIHSVCAGKRNIAGGLHWEYAEANTHEHIAN